MARVYLNNQTVGKSNKVYLNKTPAKSSGRVYLKDIKPQQQIQAQPEKPSKLGGAWNTFTRNIIKPVASASNLLEDVGKIGGYGVAKILGSNATREQAMKKLGIDILGHQKDVWTGKNNRTYSDITREIGNEQSNPVLKNMIKTVGYGGDFLLDPLNKLKIAALTAKGIKAAKTGRVALSMADQANKGQRALIQIGKYNVLPSVGNRILASTTKANDIIRGTKFGEKLMNAGSAVSNKIRPAGVSREEFKILSDAKNAARNTVGFETEKAIEFAKGLGKELKDKKATDLERASLLHAIEKGDEKLAPIGLQEIWKKGVDFKKANEEAWKSLGGSVLDQYGMAHVATKEVSEAARKKALQGGKLFSTQTPQDIHREWMKVDGKITNIKDAGIKYDIPTSQPIQKTVNPLIQEARKGNFKEVYHGTDKVFKEFDVKKTPDGSIWFTDNLDSIKKGESGASGTSRVVKRFINENDLKLAGWDEYDKYSLDQLQQMGYDGIKLPDKGKVDYQIFYPEKLSKSQPLQEGVKNAKTYINKKGLPVKVEQASAMEINNALVGQGKKAIFQEDLPLAAARMGISTGRKQAGVEFLEATKGLKGEEAKKLANETYEKMTNPEALRKAIQMFDNVQNIWKAQALMAPAYHIRNIAGNLWNNFLADVKTPAYALAGNLQRKIATGKLNKSEAKLVKEMEQHGVLGTGWYGKDIEQAISSEIGANSINPFSQKFIGYRGNKAIGSAVEDNAKIAHFLSKRAEGYGAKEAADSVKKYLFDYGDLTGVEKGLFKRIMPFYTWTSKNIPLQVQQFVENPSKFSKIGIAKKDFEQGVPEPNEKYLSDYITSNSPIRVRKDKDGSTQYFLLGQWLPSAQAMDFLSQPLENILGMITPGLKLPLETLLNKSSFFKDTLGSYENIQSYPGQTKNFLGLDMNPKTINAIRSIRVLNELDKLNPGGIFGTKEKGSIWNKLGIENASNSRGSRYSPDSSQASRILNLITGKMSNYNEENSKYFYDKDTEARTAEYKSALNNALKNGQTDMAKGIIKEMSQFLQEREGEANKDVQGYELMGDKYFEDLAQNKAAETERDIIRTKMREQIRQGIANNDTDAIREAMKLDPSYAKNAIRDAIKENAQAQYTPEQQKKLYEIEQAKKRLNLQPFYKN